MSNPEVELPFEHTLSDIVKEILEDEDDKEARKDTIASLVSRATDYRADHPRSSPRDIVDHMVGSDVFDFTVTVFAAALTQGNLFPDWHDRDRRYLLARSLDREIVISTACIAEMRSVDTYYKADYLEIREIGEAEDSIALCKQRKKKLGERATPTPSHMKK